MTEKSATAEDDLDGIDPKAILSVTSYHRRDLTLAVVHSDSSKSRPVRLSLFHPLGQPPRTGLGRLDSLPVEVLRFICLSFDVSTGFIFSHVNRRARELLQSILEFRRLGQHAHEAVSSLLRTGLGPHTDITAVYSALTTMRCSACDAFSGFLFLPTTTRCCFSCMLSSQQFRIAEATYIAKRTSIPLSQLEESLPILHTIPGTYTTGHVKVEKLTGSFISRTQGSELLRKKGIKSPELVFDGFAYPLIIKFMATSSMPYVDPKTNEAQVGLSCKGCQAASGLARRNMQTKPRERMFSKEEFLQHFKQCKAARQFWTRSQETGAHRASHRDAIP